MNTAQIASRLHAILEDDAEKARAFAASAIKLEEPHRSARVADWATEQGQHVRAALWDLLRSIEHGGGGLADAEPGAVGVDRFGNSWVRSHAGLVAPSGKHVALALAPIVEWGFGPFTWWPK